MNCFLIIIIIQNIRENNSKYRMLKKMRIIQFSNLLTKLGVSLCAALIFRIIKSETGSRNWKLEANWICRTCRDVTVCILFLAAHSCSNNPPTPGRHMPSRSPLAILLLCTWPTEQQNTSTALADYGERSSSAVWAHVLSVSHCDLQAAARHERISMASISLSAHYSTNRCSD